jgi:hypothetical protein
MKPYSQDTGCEVQINSDFLFDVQVQFPDCADRKKDDDDVGEHVKCCAGHYETDIVHATFALRDTTQRSSW